MPVLRRAVQRSVSLVEADQARVGAEHGHKVDGRGPARANDGIKPGENPFRLTRIKVTVSSKLTVTCLYNRNGFHIVRSRFGVYAKI